MRGILYIRLFGALLGCVAAAMSAVPAAAQGSYSPLDESPAAALARYVRALASDPQDFQALIGAGRSALELGDTQAAAGFFARADDINPRSPLPQAGMGAVSVVNGEPLAAMPYFERARKLGAPVFTFGCDRGLAYDLLGRQADAQADYRAALAGRDADEARRRLALSLAISGDKSGALEALSPLVAKGDAAATRTRAFVLALTGDTSGAMIAIDAAMPGSWARVAPFLQRLPSLQAPQKAAAVNLGIFPEAGETGYAGNSSAAGDRLAGIDVLLSGPPAPQPAQASSWQPPAPQVTQIAYAAPVRREAAPAQRSVGQRARKIWLQLASGPNPQALPGQFQRIKSRHRDLFEGIGGYVAQGPGPARLVIGPFRSATDADTFAEDLQTVDVNAFKWSNSESDQIVPLGTE
jgi:Flp pilus assembly protein TadD